MYALLVHMMIFRAWCFVVGDYACVRVSHNFGCEEWGLNIQRPAVGFISVEKGGSSLFTAHQILL